MNEERYREEIMKILRVVNDEEFLRAVYTFMRTYPHKKIKEEE